MKTAQILELQSEISILKAKAIAVANLTNNNDLILEAYVFSDEGYRIPLDELITALEDQLNNQLNNQQQKVQNMTNTDNQSVLGNKLETFGYTKLEITSENGKKRSDKVKYLAADLLNYLEDKQSEAEANDLCLDDEAVDCQSESLQQAIDDVVSAVENALNAFKLRIS